MCLHHALAPSRADRPRTFEKLKDEKINCSAGIALFFTRDPAYRGSLPHDGGGPHV